MAKKADTQLINMNGTLYISLPARVRQDSKFNDKILEDDLTIETYGKGILIKPKKE